MSWANAVVQDPSVAAAVPVAPRPSYVPPLLRSEPLSASALELNPAWKTPANPAPTAMPMNPDPKQDFIRRIRPRWSGGRWARDPNPFDIAEKFDQLGVAEEVEMVGGGGLILMLIMIFRWRRAGQMCFEEIDLGDALYRNIAMCKYVKATPVQWHAIPISMAGRDLMACAQTGLEKTAAFCFPIIRGIMRDGLPLQQGYRGSKPEFPLALILSPTRELSSQIHEEVTKFLHQTGVKVVVARAGPEFRRPYANQKLKALTLQLLRYNIKIKIISSQKKSL